MKYMKIILLVGVLLTCFSAIETAVAQDDVDWNNRPWLDPRVIQCVREYLDKVVIPINEERRRKKLAPYWYFDDWGRSAAWYIDRFVLRNNPDGFPLEVQRRASRTKLSTAKHHKRQQTPGHERPRRFHTFAQRFHVLTPSMV